MRLSLATLPALLACCAPPRLDPVAVAQDRSVTPLPALSPPPGPATPLSGFGGYYAGLWTPAPGGSCARLAAVPRDMLVEPFGAASGVNYPLRGVVGPDGSASLAHGKAVVSGHFGPDGFTGRADSGDGCSWLVSMTRQPLIGRAPGDGPPPEAALLQDEVPGAPRPGAGTEQRLERR